MGLRDRKRLETRRRLEEAAAELTGSVGLEHATVDAISDRAGVSPRTFFNYFDCKEDAVLGAQPIALDDDVIAQHARHYLGRDTVVAIVGLLFAVSGPSITDAAAHQKRLELVYRHPQLVARQLAHMTRVTTALAEAVRAILAADPRWDGADADAAEMVLGTCFSAFRIVVKAGITHDAEPDLDVLAARTVALIRSSSARLA
ncbi:TetR family transcriptional regulator [Microbacteriaceae bacterium VKM Ac-2854]|nr:TetR family transcriptional regulator [Microbacteriaceae bacterium VKM Ac-2854]